MTKDSVIQKAQRIVVKVGSSLVTNEGKGLDHQALARWATQIAALTHLGKQVILVSSGAIAEGILRLGWTQRPSDVHQLQAAAAVGQMGLAQAYESCFRHHNLHCAQILLTHADLIDRQRYLNARSTLFTLMELGVIPIINENDTVVTDEIKVGDNDTLGALVTNLVEADALVILTDQQGLYSADPRKDPNATLIEHDQAGRLELETIAGGAGSAVGTGGMLTKILAAKRAARSGASTVIASGREVDVLLRLAAGESVGTTLHAPIERLSARKQWLADHLQLKGYVSLDQGASVALKQGGKSLLAIGVTAVEGDFGRGDVIACLDPDGIEIARGLTNYAASETRLIMRKPSHQISAILGSMNGDDLIHRDNMIINQISD